MIPINATAMSQVAKFQAGSGPAKPTRIEDAAQQFEAILMTQILRSAHDPDGGWLGGSDSSSSCATGYAEEQLALVMAQHGGFGLAKMIIAGLNANGRNSVGHDQ